METNFYHGIIALMVLLLPALIASARKHHNQNPIFLVSIIGAAIAVAVPLAGGAIWLFSLVWAFTNSPQSK